MPTSDGPFEILEKVGPNAYKVNLPGDYGVSSTFNVDDLSPYYDENNKISSLRSNSNLTGENDGDHQAKDSNFLRRSSKLRGVLRRSRKSMPWLETP